MYGECLFSRSFPVIKAAGLLSRIEGLKLRGFIFCCPSNSATPGVDNGSRKSVYTNAMVCQQMQVSGNKLVNNSSLQAIRSDPIRSDQVNQSIDPSGKSAKAKTYNRLQITNSFQRTKGMWFWRETMNNSGWEIQKAKTGLNCDNLIWRCTRNNRYSANKLKESVFVWLPSQTGPNNARRVEEAWPLNWP